MNPNPSIFRTGGFGQFSGSLAKRLHRGRIFTVRYSRRPWLFFRDSRQVPVFLLLVTLLIIIAATTGHSQVNDNTIVFERISIESGLSSNNVQCIAQDKTGYLWFGTYDGLNRFNGYSFDIYKSHPEDTTRLKDSNIYSMLVDQEGELWIGTKYGGLSRFNAETESFTTWRHDPRDERSPGHDWIVSIYESEDGTLWLGSGNGLIKVIFSGTGRSRREVKGFVTFGKHSGDPLKINRIDKAGSQKIWLSTSKGLMLFNIRTQKFEAQYTHQEAEDDSDNNNITGGVLYDHQDVLIVGSYTGLYSLEEEGTSGAFRRLVLKGNANHENSPVNVLIKDRAGQIWVGTNHGLLFKSLGTEDAMEMTHDYNDPGSLSRNHVQDIYEDRQGIIWIGTLDGGVSKYDPSKTKFKLRMRDINLSQGQEFRSFKSAYQTRDGHIWIGTDYGLHEFTKAEDRFVLKRTFPSGEGEYSSLSIGGVTSIVQNQTGELFLGHWGGGLNRIDPRTGQVRQYRFDNSESLNSNEMLSCCITSMDLDSKEDLWLGTIYGFLEWFEPESENFESYKIGEWIWDICIDEDLGKIWCATENGFCYFDLNTRQKHCYTNDPQQPGTISHDRTWAVYRDAQKRIWVGTYNGLELFDPASGSFSLYQEAGAENFIVYRINEDQHGRLWLGTQAGITRFNPLDSTFKHFTKEDGAFPEAKWSYVDHDGWMYFGGVQGVNVFEPDEIMINQVQPALVFTNFRLFNRSVIPGPDAVIKKPIGVAEEINLNYSQNVFSIEFAALNYTSTQKNSYAYKLEGFSDSWSYSGSDRTATYTNLDPGNYTFRVIASNNDNIWNEQGISIVINIEPPFWNTWWFRSLATLLLFGTIVLWIRLRIRMIKVKKRELERLVVTRTSELQHANEALESQKEEISKKNRDLESMAEEVERSSQMKVNFFTNISHELRTPLSLILGPLEKLTEEFKASPRYGLILQMMQSNMLRLLRLINQLLDLSKVDGGFMRLQVAHGNIVSFTRQIYSSFEFMAKRNAITYEFNHHLSDPMAYFDADKVEKILYNVISNAFKFTPHSGSIRVTLDGAYGPDNSLKKVTISVEDTGKGIEPADIQKIFDRFEKGESEDNTGYLPGKGIGLSLAQSLARLHHGMITVHSSKKTGTRFDVVLGTDKTLFPADQIVAQHLDMHRYPVQPDPDTMAHDIESDPLYPPTLNPELDTILVVEDNHDLRRFIALELSGYFNVISAENGKQGWKHCLDFHPDIVLSDIMMPEMSGTALCTAIKSDERTSHIQVILLTARATIDDQKKGLEYGADDYIMKPFSIQVLKLKVKNLLETRKKIQAKYRDMGILPSITSQHEGDKVLVQKAIAVVERNLGDPTLDPQKMSRELGLSRSLLYAKLKSLTGMSVNEFVKDIRLKKAAWILQHHRDLPVSQVATEVGFMNHSHFTRSFREHFGMSPSEYTSV